MNTKQSTLTYEITFNSIYLHLVLTHHSNPLMLLLPRYSKTFNFPSCRHYLSMTCYSSLPVYSKHYTSTKQKLLSPPPKQSIQSTGSSLTFVVFRCFEIVLVQVASMLFSWKYRTKREQIIAKKRYQQLTVYLTFKFSCHQ